MGGDVLKPRPAPEIDLLIRMVQGAVEGAMEAVFGQDAGASGFPERTQTLTGSDFIKELQKPGVDRRDLIRQQFANGNVPDFMREPVTVEHMLVDANGEMRMVRYEVLPNYLCVGTNADHVVIPMDAALAQEIAGNYGYSLPTAWMADQIYQADDAFKMVAIHPGQDTVAGYAAHDKKIKEQYQTLHSGALGMSYEEYVAVSGSPGLMVGHKKDLVLTDRLNDPNFQRDHAERLKGAGVTGAIALYGFYDANGKPIQDQGGHDGMADRVHHADFVDYSQGARMVSGQVEVQGDDGQMIKMSLKEALAHPQYHALFSSEGVMNNPTSYWKP